MPSCKGFVDLEPGTSSSSVSSLSGLENGKQVVKRTGMVGHKSLSTKRLMVESLSDMETSIFKALLTYHCLILVRHL